MTDATFAEIEQLISETDVQTSPVRYGGVSCIALNPTAASAFANASYFGGSAFGGAGSFDSLARPESVNAARALFPGWGTAFDINRVGGRLESEAKQLSAWPQGVGATAMNSIYVGAGASLGNQSSWHVVPDQTAFGLKAGALASIAVARGIASGRAPHWLRDAVERMNELLGLPPGWDTYEAERLAPQVTVEALRFLSRVMEPETPAPTIVPVSDGGVQLEWHRAGLDVEVLFSDGDEDGLYYHDVATGEEWEGHPIEGFIRLDLARRLQSSIAVDTL